MRFIRAKILATALVLGGGPALAQDFDKGLATNKVGDYASALQELLLLAENEDPEAKNEVIAAPVSHEGLSAEGAGVYSNRCAKCHGRNGEGQQHGHDAAPRLRGNFARLSVSEITVQVYDREARIFDHHQRPCQRYWEV